jgi:hypothetical protein
MFNFKTYMLDCATHLKDIGHDDTTKRFFRCSGIAGLEELLNQQTDVNGRVLVIHNNEEGSVGDISRADSFLDSPYYVFYVLEKVEDYNDFDAEELAKQNCKAAGFKILSRMIREKRLGQNGLSFLDFTSIPYQNVGPIGVNFHGVMFSFTVTDIDNKLVYSSEDWV